MYQNLVVLSNIFEVVSVWVVELRRLCGYEIKRLQGILTPAYGHCVLTTAY